MDDLPNAASVALLDGDRVLLIRRARAPYAGLWTLPGGRLEPGETPEQCAVREVREELGLDVAALAKLMTMRLGGEYRLAVFASRSFTGRIVASDEIADHRWIRPEEIGALAVTPGLADVLAAAEMRLRQT